MNTPKPAPEAIALAALKEAAQFLRVAEAQYTKASFTFAARETKTLIATLDKITARATDARKVQAATVDALRHFSTL